MKQKLVILNKVFEEYLQFKNYFIKTWLEYFDNGTLDYRDGMQKKNLYPIVLSKIIIKESKLNYQIIYMDIGKQKTLGLCLIISYVMKKKNMGLITLILDYLLRLNIIIIVFEMISTRLLT